MKPELNLDAPGYADARAAWRGAPRAAAAAASPGRNFWIGLLAAVLVASVALALSSGQFRPRGFGPYSVSVPLTFKPYDPTRWAVMNSDSYADALKIDPTLPDPSSVGYADATALPPADPAQLRDEAFVGPAAKSYVFRGVTALDRERAHYCLTSALYYEAASESDDGMRGVAQTVLNRVRHPSFPNTVCGVVFQGSERAGVCQFTFSCDGAMARAPSRDNWLRSGRRARHPLSHHRDLAALGQEPGDDQHRRRPYLPPLARPLGHARRVPRALSGPRAGAWPLSSRRAAACDAEERAHPGRAAVARRGGRSLARGRSRAVARHAERARADCGGASIDARGAHAAGL